MHRIQTFISVLKSNIPSQDCQLSELRRGNNIKIEFLMDLSRSNLRQSLVTNIEMTIQQHYLQHNA